MYFLTLLIIFLISFCFLFNPKAKNKDFLLSLGIITSYEPYSAETLTIPEEFDSIYESYNLIQLQSGFDLSEYRGTKVKKYTYEVLNFPDCEKKVYVNLLCKNMQIIGGDLVCPELDGFLLPLNYMKVYIKD